MSTPVLNLLTTSPRAAKRQLDQRLALKRSTTVGAAILATLRSLALFAGVLAIGFSYFGRRLDLLEFRPGGSTFDTAVRPIFFWLFVVGLLVALRWELVGGVLAIFAAAGVVAFATNQLIATHAWLTVGGFAFPAVLWVAIDLIEWERRRAMLGLALAALAAIAGYRGGLYAYDRVLGPTHPESDVVAPQDSPTEWIWVGRTTTSGAEIRAKFRAGTAVGRVAVATDPMFDEPQWFDGATVAGFPILSYALNGLDSGETYFYAVEADGELDLTRSGSFTTFPTGPSSFTVAFGACARVGSNGAVFDAIRQLDPLLYTIVGDMHYGDNDVDGLQRYHEVLDLTLTRPAQAALYRSTSTAYVWDDHDYGANDSDGDSFARAAAMASYRQYVPSYDLAGPTSPVFQAFTIGRVRFLLTDARAARDPSSRQDDATKSMLGKDQKAWLKRELVDGSQNHALVVWINPVPWIADVEEGADHWGGYSVERRELADHVADNDITNLVMVSGDSHMVAIDDGSHSGFASDADRGAFPVLHAAALDRPGSVKGGPYSEGAIGGGGQFGSMEVIDVGGAVEVVLAAHDWRGETLLSYRFTVDAKVGGQSSD